MPSNGGICIILYLIKLSSVHGFFFFFFLLFLDSFRVYIILMLSMDLRVVLYSEVGSQSLKVPDHLPHAFVVKRFCLSEIKRILVKTG